MWTTAQIKKYVFNLPDGQPFATRELLGFGPRDAVDKSLERLVKTKVIQRVARGVFVKPLYEQGKLKMPTLSEIVITKAKAFGKELLLTHGKDAAYVLKLTDSGNHEPTYVASGSSTSFVCQSSDFGEVRVHLRSSNSLSKKFTDSHTGVFFRAMRSLPRPLRCLETFVKATQSLSRTQRTELRAAAKWMPAWLSNMFWMKPPASRQPDFGPHFWDFLKAHLPKGGLAQYLKINIASWGPEESHWQYLLFE